MKKISNTTILRTGGIICLMMLLNLPLLLLAKRHSVSHEQIDFPSPYENPVILSSEEINLQKQLITTSEDGFNEISLLAYNDKIFAANKKIKLSIYSANKKNHPIRETIYSVKKSNPAFSIIKLPFEKIKKSKNRKYVLAISSPQTPANILTEFVKNNPDHSLNVRTYYYTPNILGELYYRTSQYKPSYFKGLILPVLYILFNFIFLLSLTKIIIIMAEKNFSRNKKSNYNQY